MADKKLREFSYSPGYSDMRGAYHREFLKKNEKGEWVFVSEDCESINDPTIITTYGVSLEAVT